MNRILDREKLQGALDDAAALSRNLIAQKGAIDLRTGPKEMALRIRNEVQIAIMNWATVEALNARVEEVEDALASHAAWQPAKFAGRALVRDVIASLMRLTEGAGKDLESLGRFVALVDGLDEQLISTSADGKLVKGGLDYVRERIRKDWSKGAPSVNTIYEQRVVFRPIRDSLIAHAKDYSQLDLSRDAVRIRTFLKDVSLLADAACVVCNIGTQNMHEFFDLCLNEAHNFWGIVLSGCKEIGGA